MLFITQEDELSLNESLQCLYFYASWMPYHNRFITMIDKMESKYKNILFYAIDTDQFKSQCKRFSIDSVPTVLILKNGKEIKRINGLTLTSAFKAVFVDISMLDRKSGEKNAKKDS